MRSIWQDMVIKTDGENTDWLQGRCKILSEEGVEVIDMTQVVQSPKQPFAIDKKIWPNEPCPCGSGKEMSWCGVRPYLMYNLPQYKFLYEFAFWEVYQSSYRPRSHKDISREKSSR